ncbi:MAG: LysR family transcriptional regulator [Pseudomonadales bacterium]
MLNSKQIEVFYTVYKEGSLTRAARRLNVSQPSISNSLRYSEQKLNLKLFLRRGRKLIPTPEADILYKHAEAVNQKISQFNNVSRNLLADPKGYINVGCTPSLGLRLMPSLINAYLQQEPGAQINLVNLQSAELESQLLELTYASKTDAQKGRNAGNDPPGIPRGRFHSRHQSALERAFHQN